MTERWIKTHCARFDHGACGLEVLVRDGKLVRVRADKADPYSRGYCCPKGLASIDRVEHPGRLKHPLLRKGARGEGRWEAVSWDAALDALSGAFKKAIENGGPESVAFAQGAPKGIEFFVLMRLANLLNSPNVGAAQHVCHMPREQMAVTTCGFFPVPDFDAPSRCILLWGGDPERTNEEGVLGGHFLRALDHGPKLIVVDPVRTGPARKADIWLQVRPGADDLLAAGFLHVIIEEGLYDRDFVEQWTTGFSDLREAMRPFSPEAVSTGTWVPREKLVEAARLYAASRPAILHWGNAVEHSANSSQNCRALASLMALTGNLEAPGGNVKAEAPNLARLAEFICLKQFPGRVEKLLNRHHGITPRLVTTPNWMVYRSILDQSPYAIKCLYLQGTNPVVTGAQAGEVREALAGLDFLAVSDIFMTPSAALADLVLPVATHLEFNDIGHFGLPHGHVFARPKAVEPTGESRPDIWILNEWGKRMGLGQYFWDTPEQILETVLAPSGLTYDQFAEKGMLSGEKRYYSFREKGFATPSGKVELRSSLFEKWGYPAVPSVAKPPETSGEFPLLLTSRKPRLFFHSAYRQIERLRERAPVPRVLIHPEEAARLGISDGETVKIVTSSGSIRQVAAVSEDIDPKVAVADFGWWFPEKEQEGFGWDEANFNCLTDSAGPKDPALGTIQLRALPCRVEKCGPGK